MASRGSKKTGMNWVTKKKGHESFLQLELADVIEKVKSTLVYKKRSGSNRPEKLREEHGINNG